MYLGFGYNGTGVFYCLYGLQTQIAVSTRRNHGCHLVDPSRLLVSTVFANSNLSVCSADIKGYQNYVAVTKVDLIEPTDQALVTIATKHLPLVEKLVALNLEAVKTLPLTGEAREWYLSVYSKIN